MTRAYVEYMVIQGEGDAQFAREVSQALKAGWRCQGGVAFIVRPGDAIRGEQRLMTWFAQAMIYEMHVSDGPGDG